MPRNSAVDAARTRSKILIAATDQASLEGLEGLTIGRLADTVGLSKAGLIGPFGSKEGLQLAVLGVTNQVFTARVWRPAADQPAGRARLLAICEHWVKYLTNCPLPGGCFICTTTSEWDGREGPVRDAVAESQDLWLKTLRADAEVAIRAGELAPDPDADEMAFGLNAIAMGLNQAVQLFNDPAAAGRAEKAFARLLATP
jgi:AcrR family transcriptional regulator